MKKKVIALVFSIAILGMVGWSIYEFILASNEPEVDQTIPDDIEQGDFESTRGETLVENELELLTPENTIGLDIGNLAPDFKLTTLNGEEVALSDYRGNPVMLNFWATWCPPCRAEMPDMERFHQDTDVEILAVNLLETERTIEDVHQFADEYELTFPILLDEYIEVAMIYGIQPIPTSYMIDSEGMIQFITFGPLTYEQMNQVLDDIN